ncbi:hypothetical protein [Helicobacter cetorum]|uniref:Uncharacterized protein n=1 Tax=Helicobacter cetorum (strain ATCC BAA-429 / MIT 00-7128) TaxID=182217 RepID=I0EMX3_HELC0|nr:hypothetical protein [Helicobacter cetorum]AFI04292.1 hypothetical protein HCW_05125 [Helicobacter cetorum MIT 00-7128]
MEKSYKKYVAIVVGFIAILILTPPLFVYAIDPFMFFRKANYRIDYSTEQDEPLLFDALNTYYPFDNIITGSSISLNINLNEVEDILYLKKPIKFALSGAEISAILPFLSLVTQKRTIKNIVMDFFVLRQTKNGQRFPAFMEARGYPYFIRTLAYLYYPPVFKKSLYYFFHNYLHIDFDIDFFKNTPMRHKFIDYPMMFKIEGSKNNPQENVNHMIKTYLKHNYDLAYFQEKKQQHLQWAKQLEDFVKKHPNIHFIFWIDPEAMLAYYTYYRQETLKDNLTFEGSVAKNLLKYPNVEIHDLRTMPLTTNLQCYLNARHLSIKCTTQILKAIKSKKYLLNENNIDLFNQKLIKMIEDYQIPKEIHN